MTVSPDPDVDIDARLVAYLDGELDAAERTALDARLRSDPALRERLDTLAAGGLPSTEGFDLLLSAAPTDRLAALLAGAEAEVASARRPVARRSWRLPAIAAALVLLVAGAAAGFALARFALPGADVVAETEPPGWRAVVAEYLSLFTPDTLAVIPNDPTLTARELADVGSRVSLALTPEKVSLPDLQLKRVQLLRFNDMPLAQIAYLSPEAGPVALCIIANGKPDAAAAFEERLGQNIVFWTRGGRGFMIIGKVPRETLEALAASLESRLS